MIDDQSQLSASHDSPSHASPFYSPYTPPRIRWLSESTPHHSESEVYLPFQRLLSNRGELLFELFGRDVGGSR